MRMAERWQHRSGSLPRSAARRARRSYSVKCAINPKTFDHVIVQFDAEARRVVDGDTTLDKPWLRRDKPPSQLRVGLASRQHLNQRDSW